MSTRLDEPGSRPDTVYEERRGNGWLPWVLALVAVIAVAWIAIATTNQRANYVGPGVTSTPAPGQTLGPGSDYQAAPPGQTVVPDGTTGGAPSGTGGTSSVR